MVKHLCPKCEEMVAKLQEFLAPLDVPGNHSVRQALAYELIRRGIRDDGDPLATLEFVVSEARIQTGAIFDTAQNVA